MASRMRGNGPLRAPMYEQLLLFPERAEYLEEGRFESYRVSLEHWSGLAETFREAFETVYERRSARVLLVHGGQGHGKSLFVRTLQRDFDESARTPAADVGNLWQLLAGGTPFNAEIARRASDTTVLRRVDPRAQWSDAERAFAKSDTHAARVFLFDDAHKDAFVREWADLGQADYARLRADGHRRIALESVAQRIVEDLRGDFRRSVFVLLSNDVDYLDQLKLELDRSHQGLARRVELPLPAPSVKEEIVRTNTNLLNQRSYWFCLDQGGPEEKQDAHRTLMGDRGFIDSFQAIGRALAAQHRAAKRSGRPANKNLLTLVTLGTTPADVASFIADRELEADETDLQPHLGVWWFRNRWASALKVEPGGGGSRRASLVESEFSLRWVALDMSATWLVCTAPAGDAAAGALAETIRIAPSIGHNKATKNRSQEAIKAASDLVAARAVDAARAEFEARFAALGQQRSQIYEAPIAKLLGRPLSKALAVWSQLKPDIILEEYAPCAVTRASSADEKAIELAIKRGCHVIEVTAHLQDDMRGLDGYLANKVQVYAELLESV